MSACPAALWVWCRTPVLTASGAETPARHSHIEATSSHVTCGTSELPQPPPSRPETEAGTRTGSWVTDSCPLKNFTCQLAEQQVCKTQHSTFCS